MSEITVEQVLAVSKVRREVAVRLAEYANYRARGNPVGSAQAELVLSPTTVSRYERWMIRFRQEIGLGPLPGATTSARARNRAVRWSIARKGGDGT